MQTLTSALIDLVLNGEVDRELAAAAAPSHHDFVVALEHALKARNAARRNTQGDGEVLPTLRLASGAEPPAA
jgi:hypothetical protein